MTSTIAHVWLEAVGGTCAYEQYEETTTQGTSPRWSGIFKRASFDNLQLSDGTDSSLLSFELRLCCASDASTLKALKLEGSFGQLQYLDGAEPPLVGGTLVLHTDTLNAVAEAIRTGRGAVQVLIASMGYRPAFPVIPNGT